MNQPYDLDNIFKHHPPNPHQRETYEHLREMGKCLARTILKAAPDCRERSLALTKIEEAIMWANASIARDNTPGEVRG